MQWFARHQTFARLRQNLLTTTALALGLGLATGGSASAQSYNAGTGSSAGGTNATAVGPNANAAGNNATAVGSGANAAGNDSVASGSGASSPGNGSVAIGKGATANSAANSNNGNPTAQGIINYRSGTGDGNAGTGTPGNAQAGSNGAVAPPNGDNTAGAIPSGTAIGEKSTVGAGGGVAIGYNNSAGTASNGGAVYNSTAIGVDNNASAAYSTAIGYANIASGRSTLSLGTANQATGDIAVALGRQSYAMGPYSFAAGFVASAWGQDTIALGRLAVAGENNGASSVSDIAIGDNSLAQGGSALALGSGARTTNARAVAIGAGSMALRGTLSGNEAFSGSALSANASEFSVGAAGSERQITNVAGGQRDTDAVNVRQLRGLGNTLGTTLGSSFDPTTNAYTAPSYGYNGRTYQTIPDLAGAIDTFGLRYDADGNGNRLASIDLTRGGTVGSAVSITGLAPATADNGAVALSQMPLRYSTANAPTTANSATPSNDVTLVGANSSLPVALHNLASGTADSDAATVGQLRLSDNALAGALGGGAAYDPVTGAYTAPSYSVGGRSYGDVASALAATNRLAVQYVPDSNGNPTSVVDLAPGGGTPVSLRSVAAGNLAAGSTDAVNGGQLYQTNQTVAALAGGSVGLVQQDSVSRTITVGTGTDGSRVSFLNQGGTARTLAGVAGGQIAAGSTEAINGGQLYQTNQAVAALANGGLGLVQQDPTSRAITVGAGTDGTLLSLANQNGTSRTLTGVAAGQIAAGSADAINGSQIRGISNSVASVLGGGAGVAADGSLTAPSYSIQGTNYQTVGGALSGLDVAVSNLNASGSRYLSVRSTAAPAIAQGLDSVALGAATVATADRGVALGAGSVAGRAGMNGATEAFTGTSVASNQGAISVGDLGSERQITNVAGGTQATDAVNVRQLRSVGTNLAGALGGGAGFAADGSFTAPTYTVANQRYASVGDALGALDNVGVKYDVDPTTGRRGQAVTLAGGDPNQPVLIRSVAAGVLPTDAANVGQVTQARAEAYAYADRAAAGSAAASAAYTDAAIAPLQQQVSAFGAQLAGLQGEVVQARVEARRGAAIGLAAASLRFDDRPGKLSVAAGGGAWRGEAAASFGVGYTLPDGSARVNATGVAAGRDFGIGAGASITLN
jgi:autotransporter adhesin